MVPAAFSASIGRVASPQADQKERLVAQQRNSRARIEEVRPQLADISRWMYENPELAYEEHESSARLADFLARNGFAVTHPAYGLETAFAARVGTTGPHVVICAEYDALPGVGHACGHNIIATAALGAGYALAPLADSLGIRVTVLGTPAEEKYGGKVDLIEAGAFDDVDVAMMIHPAPMDVVDPRCIAVAHLESTTAAERPMRRRSPSRASTPSTPPSRPTSTSRLSASTCWPPTRSTGSSPRAGRPRT